MLSNEELMQINGGAITAALVTSVVNALTKLYSVGQSFGSTLRRLVTKNYCSL